MTKLILLSALVVGSIYGGTNAIDSLQSSVDNRTAAIEQYTE